MSTRERVPEWMLERLLLGEVDERQRRELLARLDAEPGGRERLAALEASNQAILREHPPHRMQAILRERAAVSSPKMETSRRTIRWLPALAAAVPALAALALLWGGPGAPRLPTDPEGIRSKGLTPHLIVHRQQGLEAERIAPGGRAIAGDRLQVSYVAAGRSHGAIFSLDGSGALTLHLPRDPARAEELEPEGSVALPFSFELDEAPAFERFFFITASSPFSLAAVLAAAEELAALPAASAASAELPLPAGLEQSSFLLTKPTTHR